MKAMGIGAGDEVITTPFTFIATANCILMVDAKPVFVDIDPVSYNLDASKIEKAITKKTKAILPVEVFGNPAGMDEIRRIADKHGLMVLEDCCEALGSKLDGKPAGNFGKMGVFAFYPNKQMTTGEGGMIVTDDEKLAALCVSMRNQGRGGRRRVAGPRAAGVQLPAERHQLRAGDRTTVADRGVCPQTPRGGRDVSGNIGQ